jgi:spermidine/putrescine-binding protein
MLNAEHAAQNVTYIGYPMPLDGAEDAFAKLVKDDPSIEITTDDLENGSQFKELTPAAKKAWDRVWTEVKA